MWVCKYKFIDSICRRYNKATMLVGCVLFCTTTAFGMLPGLSVLDPITFFLFVL